MYESAFERKLCDYIKSLGGKAYKWVSPGSTVWRISDMDELKARLREYGI